MIKLRDGWIRRTWRCTQLIPTRKILGIRERRHMPYFDTLIKIKKGRTWLTTKPVNSERR